MGEIAKIKNHMNNLIKKIKYHEHMFHVIGQQTISDSLYDSWRKELEDLERAFPHLIISNSPSLYVGEAPLGSKIKREIPMLSLRHSYNRNEIERFCEDFKNEYLVIEPKVDGVALSIVYRQGKIESVSLRGDGYEGENISHLAEFIHDLPLYCNYDIEVRGEAYLPKNIQYDNRRNFTAGYLRKKHPEPSQIHFIAYKLINNTSYQTHALEYMQSLGFNIVPFKKTTAKEATDSAELFWKQEFPFETDGVVIKIDNLNLNLGNTIRYTKDAIAYKFSIAGMKTTITKIEWSISKTGILIPTCIFDEIKINGCSISRCHAHNKKNLEIKKIGIGAVVSVVRVGNVIPYIEQVIHEGQPVILVVCPFCNHKINVSTLNYICANQKCIGILKIKFIYFFENLKIRGLGEKLILRFFEEDSELWDMILKTIRTLKNQKWILDKNDLKVFDEFQSKRFSITIDDLIISSSVEGIATFSQLEKIRQVKGKRQENLQKFLSLNTNYLTEILFELINP